VLIVVPSYNRSQCLRWVLKSLYRCDVSGIGELTRIVVVNNHPPSRGIVDSIVGEFSSNSTIVCRVRHRQETIPGIDSWYSAIAEFATENEAVFLLGDDDLMMPWGLNDRYREILRNEADMLLSDFARRIYFCDEGRRYWLTGPLPVQSDQATNARRWDFLPAAHPEASFMSNHCYRNTASFREGLRLAFEWCDSQPWLPRSVRTGMLPLYLPYTISLSGGKVLSLRSKCVLRGACAEEATRSTYADGGNTVFYNLCAYDIFVNQAFPPHTEELARVGAHLRQGVIRGFLTMLGDKGITLQMLATTLRHSGLGPTDLFAADVLHGVPKVAIRLLGLRGARLRIISRSRALPRTEQLFQ
jgi:hypothetical protein